MYMREISQGRIKRLRNNKQSANAKLALYKRFVYYVTWRFF